MKIILLLLLSSNLLADFLYPGVFGGELKQLIINDSPPPATPVVLLTHKLLYSRLQSNSRL